MSSARNTSPGPKILVAPSPTRISTEPERVITYWRRGAGCHSRMCGEGSFLKTTAVAPCALEKKSEPVLVTSSSKCDCPSSPVYNLTKITILPLFPVSCFLFSDFCLDFYRHYQRLGIHFQEHDSSAAMHRAPTSPMNRAVPCRTFRTEGPGAERQ